MCWHERWDGTLVVTIGSECGPHREAEFQRRATRWALKDERDVVGNASFLAATLPVKVVRSEVGETHAVQVVPVA
jgi:hypothetical protein